MPMVALVVVLVLGVAGLASLELVGPAADPPARVTTTPPVAEARLISR